PFVQSVTNPHPSFGGEDEETVEEARDRAPSTLRNRDRAVTVEDFGELAKQTPGASIKRAQAFPLLNPNFRLKRTGIEDTQSASQPRVRCGCKNATCGCNAIKEQEQGDDRTPQPEVPIPGALTVIVVPDGVAPDPMPTQGT